MKLLDIEDVVLLLITLRDQPAVISFLEEDYVDELVEMGLYELGSGMTQVGVAFLLTGRSSERYIDRAN